MHCDHMVYISTDLSLWLDNPVFWAPWHQSIESMSTYCQLSFAVPPGREVGYGWMETRHDISRTVEDRG